MAEFTGKMGYDAQIVLFCLIDIKKTTFEVETAGADHAVCTTE